MSEVASEVGEEIRRIAGNSHVVQTGVVKAVDADTCTVERTIDDAEAPCEGVVLNVKLENVAGILLKPTVGADCLILKVDDGSSYELIKASAYDGVTVTAATLIQLNDGSLGGLTKTLELKAQINKLNSTVNHLVAIINGATVPEPGNGAASALQIALKGAIATDQPADFSQIENTKVKHGV